MLEVRIQKVLIPCYVRRVRTYATTLKLKKKAFTLNIQNIKRGIGILLTFILELKFQNKHFVAKYDSLSY